MFGRVRMLKRMITITIITVQLPLATCHLPLATCQTTRDQCVWPFTVLMGYAQKAYVQPFCLDRVRIESVPFSESEFIRSVNPFRDQSVSPFCLDRVTWKE